MKLKKQKSNGILERILSLPTWFWVTVIIALTALGLVRRFGFGVICILKELTGISCPACGMSRALLSLVRFDIAGAFRYHPVFWVFPIACFCGIMCAVTKKRRKPWVIGFAVCVAVFLICWIIRLATGTTV